MTPSPTDRRRRSAGSARVPAPRRVLASVAALGVLCGLTATPAAASEEEAPSTNRLFEQSRPAVQLVVAEYAATVSVPRPQVNQTALQQLVDELTARVIAGEVSSDEQTLVNEVVEAMAAEPDRYFEPSGEVRTEDVSFASQGSGFVVSPDGYVVTNAHVAAPDEATLRQAVVEQGLEQILRQDARAAARALSGTLTDDQTATLVEAIAGWEAQYVQVGEIDQQVYTAVGVSVPGIGKGQKGTPAEVVASGEEIPGKDVAILKIEGNGNLPTLPLGNDRGMETGDAVHVIGYPGAATFHPALSEESAVEPTLTGGVVSARKQASSGYQVIQTNADMTHGNSGGPAIDAQGRVVGIATFGTVDPSTGEDVAGLNFVVPTTVVQEFLDRANVTPKQSVTTEKYGEALEYYDKRWYSEALPLFREVDALDPGHPYVQDLITSSQTAVSQGRDETPTTVLGMSVPVFAGLLVLLLAVLGGLGFWLVRRRGSTDAEPPPAYATAGAPHAGAAAAGGEGAYASPTVTTVAPTPPPAPAPPPQATPQGDDGGAPGPDERPTAPVGFAPPPADTGAAPSGTGAAATEPPTDTLAAAPVPRPRAEHRFCASCGAEHAAGARFCASCGEPLA